MSSSDRWSGKERRSHQTEGIHRWRWRSLAIWIVIFTIAVGWSIRVQRKHIQDLKNDKASIASLQRTNCGLRKFLITAEKARHAAALREHGKARQRDQAAARGYAALAQNFTLDNCEDVSAARR